METVSHPVSKIGRRFAGSRGEEEAAHYLADKFSQPGLRTRVERFRFMGWELLEAPRLHVLSPGASELP